MLLSDFNALGPISMPTPPTVALTEFFHTATVASVHPLPVSWYLISLFCMYLCSCMHIMSILCSMADAVSSGSWPILFKVLTLTVAICIVCLHFSSFCCLSSVADFSNTEARMRPFFICTKSDTIYVYGLSVAQGYLLILFTNPSTRAGYDTRSIFLSGVYRVWISPRLVASPRLKNLVCPTIYP